MIKLFILLLLVHWLADFALQTPEQANNKWYSYLALLGHVSAYTVCIAIAIFIFGWGTIDLLSLLVVSVFIGGTHFVIDRETSNITHRLYEEKRYHDFFVVIGFDQLLHNLTLLFAAHMIGGV